MSICTCVVTGLLLLLISYVFLSDVDVDKRLKKFVGVNYPWRIGFFLCTVGGSLVKERFSQLEDRKERNETTMKSNFARFESRMEEQLGVMKELLISHHNEHRLMAQVIRPVPVNYGATAHETRPEQEV